LTKTQGILEGSLIHVRYTAGEGPRPFKKVISREIIVSVDNPACGFHFIFFEVGQGTEQVGDGASAAAAVERADISTTYTPTVARISSLRPATSSTMSC